MIFFPIVVVSLSPEGHPNLENKTNNNNNNSANVKTSPSPKQTQQQQQQQTTTSMRTGKLTFIEEFKLGFFSTPFWIEKNKVVCCVEGESGNKSINQ
jgi:hypothetical protein